MDQEQPTRMHEQAVPTDVKSCPSCGEDLEDDQRFCEACGLKLDDPPTPLELSLAELDEDPLARLGKLWPVIALALVILAVLAWRWVYTLAILPD